MANNLEITAGLNQLLQKQNALLITQAKIQKAQLNVMIQMASVFKDIDPSQFSNAMSELDTAIQSAGKSTEKMGESTQNLSRNFDKMSKETARSMGLLGGMGRSHRDLLDSYKQLIFQSAKFQGALHGIGAVTSIIKGVSSVFTGLLETFWNLTTAIVAIPFKILGALFDNAIQGGSEYRRLLEEIRKEFGDLTKNSAKAVVALGRSMKGELAETGLSVYRVFGNLVERTQALFAAAKALGSTFNLLRDSIAENSEVFAAYYKGLGLSDEAFKALGVRAAAAGDSVQNIGREMVQFADSMGTAFGINTREITKDVGEMMRDIRNFGNLSVEQLSEVSVYARRLGIEFQKLTGVVDAFDNFEKAAEGAAQLAQAFGLNVDAVKLVQEQDPAARFEMIRKSFFATGRTVENMTRQELRLLAAQTGLDEETVKLGFSLKSQSLSYAQVQKQGESARKKTLTQEEAMQKLSGSIDRLVKDGQQLQGGLFERFFQGFLKGVQLSLPFRQMMREISRTLRIVYMEGRKVGRIFVELFPGVKNIFTAMKDLFNADRFRKTMTSIRLAFTDFFKGLTTNPASSLKALFERLKKAFFDHFNDSSGAGRKLLTGFKEFFSTLLKVGAEILRTGIKGLIGIVRGLIDLIRDPSSLTKGAEAGGGIAGQILEMFMPLVDALKEMLPPLWDAVSDLLTELGERAMDWLWSRKGTIGLALVSVFGAYIAAGLLGAVTSGLVAGAAQKAGGILVELLGTKLKGARGLGGAAGAGRAAASASSAVAEGAAAAGPAATAARGAAAAGTGVPWAAAAKVIGGVLLVAGAIFLLALAVQHAGITLEQIGVTSAILLAAGLIVAAAIPLSAQLAALGGVAGGAPAVALGGAFVAVLAGIMAGAMALLILAFGNYSIAEIATTTAVMLAGATIVAALGLVALELAAVGLFAAPAILGAVAVFALGTAIARGMPEMLKTLNSLNTSELASAATIMGSIVLVLGGIGLLATALGTIGAVVIATGGTALLAIVAGIYTINQVTISLVENVRELFKALNSISIPGDSEARFNMFIEAVGAIVGFGTMITELGASTSAGWLATLLGASDQQVHNLNALKGVISQIQESLVGVITGLTSAVNDMEGGDEALSRAQAISGVVSALSGVVGGLVPPADSPFWEDDTWNGIDDVRSRLSQYSSSIVLVLGSLGTLVSRVIEEFTRPEFASAAAAFGTEGGAKAIQGIVSVFEVVGRLGSSLAGTVMTQLRGLKADANVSELINNAVSFIQRIMSALFTGGFLESVGDLITHIVTRTSNLTKEQISRFQAVSPIFTAMFGAISSMGDAISGAINIASGLESPEAQAEALESIRRFVGEIFDGIGDIASTVIPQLITAFRGLKSGDISRIKSGTDVLGSLFGVVSSVTTGIQPLYDLARTAGGGGTDFASIRSGLGTIFSLFWDSDAGGVHYEGLPTMLNRVAESFSTVNVGAFKSTANAIKAMVTQVNAVSNSFRTLNENPLNITTELKRLATNLGVGSAEAFTIRHDSFNVTINVEVKLLIEELEEAVKNRPGGSKFVLSTIQ